MNDKIKNIAKIILLSVVPMTASCGPGKSKEPDVADVRKELKAIDVGADFARIQVGWVGDSEQITVPVNNLRECFDATQAVAEKEERRTVGFCYQWVKDAEREKFDYMVGAAVRGSKYDKNSSDGEYIWGSPYAAYED